LGCGFGGENSGFVFANGLLSLAGAVKTPVLFWKLA
jgi:hypothetical protein